MQPEQPDNQVLESVPGAEPVKFAGSPNTSELKELSRADIDRLLATLPRTKYEYGVKVKEQREIVDMKKNELKRVMAKLQLEASAKKDELKLSSSEDRKAWATNHTDAVNAEFDLVVAKGAHEMAILRFDYLDDLFTSVRKVASMVLADADAAAQAARYERPEEQR